MSIFVSGLIGGILVGLAAAIYLLGNGRIMGISGLVGALASGFKSIPEDWPERVIFLVALISSPLIYALFFDLPDFVITSNLFYLIIGGFLVGFGSRMGSGCTSGHGILGLGRFSKRSLVAVVVFMAFAIITVYITHHIIGA